MRETTSIQLRKAPGSELQDDLRAAPVYAKRPGVITFVIDVSSSMGGAKLEQAKKGLLGALEMPPNNQVGLISFADDIRDIVPVAPLPQSRGKLTETIKKMSTNGCTALYEAIKEGVEMTDSANGAAEDNHAVVILTDGQANQGQISLHDIIKMKSRAGRAITKYTGFESEYGGLDSVGNTVGKRDIVGSELAINTKHPIQIFFIGIGNDADMEIGRLLAEATGAESQKGFQEQKVPRVQRVREIDIARVLEEFKYF